MSKGLTPFVRQADYRREEATYLEEARHRDLPISPQAAPDPIREGDFNPRRSRRWLTFFFHPDRPEADNFVWRNVELDRAVPYVPGQMASWSLRYNVYSPTPETFGSRYEMGAPEDA